MTTHPPTTVRRLAVAIALAALGSILGACGGGEDGARTDDGRLRVTAAFYPLQWMAEQVGGEHVVVESLTKPGVEPHDLELTPKEVAAVHDAGLVVYLSGFQPSVDAAVDDGAPSAFDARSSARLDLTLADADADHDHGHDDEHEETDEHEDEDDASSADPHFWLDPTRVISVAEAFTERLVADDPDHADAYRANLDQLRTDLTGLDDDYRAGLADCESRDLVTSHQAFGYLAERYDLHQVPITGLTPEDEPSPSDLAAVTRFVEANDVRTIYFETLVSPAVAETVAAETGARTAILDPIEGLDDRSPGTDYLSIMEANLRSLQQGQPCPAS